jgi:hypothetical protein
MFSSVMARACKCLLEEGLSYKTLIWPWKLESQKQMQFKLVEFEAKKILLIVLDQDLELNIVEYRS